MKPLWILLLAALAGCASGPSHAPRARARTLADVVHAEWNFEGAGGVRLFAQSWRPAKGDPRAVLVIVHGLKDYGSRYEALAERLAGLGFETRAFDLRGHGRSDGDRVWVEEFDDYLRDLDKFLARTHNVDRPGKPIFLMGHSMGGAIVTLYTLTTKPPPEVVSGVVLSAPALRSEEVSGALIAATKAIAAIAPGAGVFELDPKGFSRDPEVVLENASEDPLIFHEGAPAHTAVELLGAIARIQERMEDFEKPVLILHGTADRITEPEGSRELAARARSADKTLELFDGFYHDLLHEPGKEQVAAAISDWLSARSPPP